MGEYDEKYLNWKQQKRIDIFELWASEHSKKYLTILIITLERNVWAMIIVIFEIQRSEYRNKYLNSIKKEAAPSFENS